MSEHYDFGILSFNIIQVNIHCNICVLQTRNTCVLSTPKPRIWKQCMHYFCYSKHLPSDNRLFPYSLFRLVEVGFAIFNGLASGSSYSNDGAPIAFLEVPFVVNNATMNHTAVSNRTAFKISVLLLRKNIVTFISFAYYKISSDPSVTQYFLIIYNNY